MLCAKLRNTRSWAFHGSLEVQQGTVKGCARKKGAESKPHVMQCVRDSHREPDVKHSTNSCRKVTTLFQFSCYAIFQDLTNVVARTKNRQRYQSYDEPNV